MTWIKYHIISLPTYFIYPFCQITKFWCPTTRSSCNTWNTWSRIRLTWPPGHRLNCPCFASQSIRTVTAISRNSPRGLNLEVILNRSHQRYKLWVLILDNATMTSKVRILNGHSFNILHMERIAGELKRANITQNEMNELRWRVQ